MSVLKVIPRSLPTGVALVALGSIGYWGHANDWRAPKFASLVGGATTSEREDWCAEHSVPESRCVKCRPELGGGAMLDWCREHGVAESRCTLCHPEILVKGVAGDWCAEHGVPESNCTLCHPEIAIKGNPPPNESDVRVFSAAAPRNPATCQTHALRVQFASTASIKKAGVTLESATERPMEQTLAANAETQYDRTRLAQVASRLPGVVWRVDKEIGQPVRKGEVLALVDAAEVGRAKAEWLTAAAQRELRAQTVRRISDLLPQKVSTPAELQEAEAALREAQIRVFNARQALVNLGLSVPETEGIPDESALQFLGLPEDLRATLDTATTSANLVPLISALDGLVIGREVVAGEVIEASKPLFSVADIGRMWLIIHVPQALIHRVSLGQDVRFRPEHSDDRPAFGTITWISTAVDDRTRTVRVRAELDNTDRRLLAFAYGRAEITVRESPSAVAVPNEAIQWEGCCHVVFVREREDLFQTRKVSLGARNGRYAEVLAGLSAGEVVATVGSHVLKSEILKSKLGAGCCEVETPK